MMTLLFARMNRALLLLALCLALPAQAAYVQVYSTIQKGKVIFTGNTLNLNSLTVSGQSGVFITTNTALQVAGYPAGTTSNYTLNGSRAVLNIPPGASVLYAELIWGGKHSGAAGTLPQASATLNGAVNLTTPSGTYAITPSGATAGSNATYYTRSANVTGLVQLAGAGTYTTGNVPALINTSSTDGAGWTLAVVLSDPSEVARNLTLFVGAELSGSSPASVSGFCTPVAGAVNGRLLVSAIEGDSSGTGDNLRFGPTSTLTATNNVSGPNNPATNFFASQINGNTGTLDTSGTFGGVNHPLGGNLAGARQAWDITNVDVSPLLINSQTVAFAQGVTSGDVYAINGLAMQIDVTTPVFPITVKKVDKATTFVGDQLTYTIDLDNRSGNGAANSVTFFDTLPPGLSYVAGSATVDTTPLTTPNPQPATGDLVSGITIGNVAVGALVRVSFKANVNALPASPTPAKFDNAARWNYTYIACAGVVAQTGTVVTSAATSTAARLEPVKTVSPTGALIGGQTATYTITMPNTGLLNTAGTTLADSIPAGTTYVAGSTKLNGVTVPDGPGGVMPYATAALVNSAGQTSGVIAQGATATVQFSVVATSSATVINQATIDPDGVGPGLSMVVQAVNSGLNGPSVTKAFAPTTIAAGGTTALTVTLTNPNASAISGAAFTDNLPGGMLIANTAGASTTCTGGSVTAIPGGTTLSLAGGQIPASASCTVSANVTVATAGSYTNTIPVGAVTSSNAGINTAGSQTITVTQAPSLSKGFTPTTVSANTSSTLTITLGNPTAAALTAVSVTDIFPTTAAGAPGNMTLFDTVTTNTCGGTLTTQTGAALAVGSDSVKLAGGTIAANNVCTITVHVKATVGGGYANTLAAGAMTSSGGANNALATATLQIASPIIDKSFAPTTVAANTASTLTITLTNVTGADITGVNFTDTYPIGLVNTAPPGTNTCGGTLTASAAATNPGTLTLAGGTILAGNSCTITKAVQSASSGSYTNTIAAGTVSSSIGPNAAPTSATLNVARPSVSKAFSVATVPLNGTATLTITLTNPTGTSMTGAAFTDTLPAGLTASVAGGTCVGTKAASGGAVSLTAGTIPANGSCTVTATITGATIGLKTNTIAAGALTVTGPVAASNGTAAVASLTVLDPPTITKIFLTSPILPVSGVTTLQIELFNGNPVALIGPAAGPTFIDVFPTTPGAMTLANTTTTNSCGGTLVNSANAALAVGAIGIRLNGGTIAANDSCVITVNVSASAAGDYINTIPAAPTAGSLSTTNGGGNVSAASAPLAVRLAAPTVAKSFAAGSIVANTSTTMTITLTNSSTTQAISGAALNDVFPAGMKVWTTPSFTNTCGGTVGAGSTANDTSIAISGATIPFNAGGTASCSVSVAVTSTVTAASPGLVNTVSPVTSTNANTSATASANLIVTAPPLTAPTIVKSFTPAYAEYIVSGTTTTLLFTLGSANTGVLTNANFTDTLVNMSVASATIGGTCSGVTNSPALAVGATALSLTVPNLPPGGCTVALQVTSSTLGANPNTVSGVTTTQTPTAGAGSGPVYLYVINKPTISKAFGPTAISAGGTSTITFTLSNPNGFALPNASFSDTLTNMTVASPTIGGTCSGITASPALVVGATVMNLSVPSLPTTGCTVTVDVTSSTVGTLPNTSSGVSLPGVSAGVPSNTANLTVNPAPLVTKAFSVSPVARDVPTLLIITITNPGAAEMTGVAFADTYPTTPDNLLVNANAITSISGAGCGGTLSAIAGMPAFSLAGGVVPAYATCTYTANVLSTTNLASASYVNSTGVIVSSIGNGAAASATLVVTNGYSVAKSFSPSTVPAGGSTQLTVTLGSTDGGNTVNVAVADTYPSGLVNAGGTPIVSSTCGGTLTATPNVGGFTLTGGSIASNSACSFVINVTAAATGTYVNTIPANAMSNTSNAGTNAVAGSATLTVVPAPTLTKSFSPASIVAGGTSQLTLSLGNTGNAPMVLSSPLTDVLPTTPGAMLVATPNGLAGTCGGVTATAGSGSVTMAAGASIPVGGCTIVVNVTATVGGTYTNTIAAGALATNSGSNAAPASAAMVVSASPTIAKAFAPATTPVETISTLTFTIGNGNAGALTNAHFTDTLTGMRVASATLGGSCVGVSNSPALAVGATGTNALNLTVPTLPVGGCTISVQVTGSVGGVFPNTASGVDTTQTPTAGTPSNTATLTLTVGVNVNGFVYNDANRNLQKDGAEAGTGLTLYAKLVSGGTALQAVAVNTGTGAYQLAAVPVGTYSIVIDDNATLADITPAVIAGWTGTEAGTLTRNNVVVSEVDLQNLNFGLYGGNTVSGRVFRDNGSGGGTPNNALQDGSESGLAGVTVRLTSADGSITYDTVTTDGNGDYRLSIPTALAGASLRVVETNLAGTRSVGGAPAPSYDRATDTHSFTYTAGTNTGNLNFADVAQETLTTPQQRSALPGETVFYAHTFTPGSGGNVTFSASSSAGWTQTVLRDSNCNGVLDAGELALTGPITVTAGTPVCVVLRINVPGGTAVGLQNVSTLQAQMAFANASPALAVTLANDDLTTVGSTGSGGLLLVKSQDNATPLPGASITYVITYTNQGSTPLSTIRINDTTPAYTRFVNASCLPPLAAALTSCSVSVSPAAGATGAVEWTLAGSLLPSASGQVTFTVQVGP
jgi:uncharacterized repeat protein (TIGR01451 family)